MRARVRVAATARATVPQVDGTPADGTVRARWVVPGVIDGQDVPIVGELVWTWLAAAAADGTEGIPWVNVVLAVAGVAAVVALLLLRRRSAARDGSPTTRRRRAGTDPDRP